MIETTRRSPPAAGLVGALVFVLIGWSGLLVPSLVRAVEDRFVQSDAGLGIYYLVYAVMYAIGTFGGGFVTERLGRRAVLTFGAVAHGLGLIGLGIAPSWTAFLLAGLPSGLGVGILDGGTNGMFLDLFRSGRGRALNLLHVCFSVGALSAPIVVGLMVGRGIEWSGFLVGTGAAALVVGSVLAMVSMPSGRRVPDVARTTAPRAGDRPTGRRGARSTPVLLLGLAMGCFVAAETGVSNWLVRFLDPAPLATATAALASFWAGLTVGRLVAARIADRFDHTRFTILAAIATSVAILGAVIAPSLPMSIALFTVAGFASGPIYPMLIVLGGDRYPERSAAVAGFLGGCGQVGFIAYPPIMGFLSVTVGLTVAMLGTAVLALASAGALVLAGRGRASAPIALP